MEMHRFKDLIYVLEWLYCKKGFPEGPREEVTRALKYLKSCGMVDEIESPSLTRHGKVYYESVIDAVRMMDQVKKEMTRQGW